MVTAMVNDISPEKKRNWERVGHVELQNKWTYGLTVTTKEGRNQQRRKQRQFLKRLMSWLVKKLFELVRLHPFSNINTCIHTRGRPTACGHLILR